MVEEEKVFVEVRRRWTLEGNLERELMSLEEVEDAIVHAYTEGVLKLSAIERMAGVSRPTIYRILRKHGIEPDRKRSGTTDG